MSPLSFSTSSTQVPTVAEGVANPLSSSIDSTTKLSSEIFSGMQSPSVSSRVSFPLKRGREKIKVDKKKEEKDPQSSSELGEDTMKIKRVREASKPRSLEELNKKPLGVTLKKVYIHQIRNGQKTVEGRVNARTFKTIREGRLVRFFYLSNAADDVICKVNKVNRYSSFKEMLTAEGYKQCVHQANTLEEAVKIYDSIPNYTSKAATHGVVAFQLSVQPK